MKNIENKIFFKIWFFLWVVFFTLIAFPISSRITRFGILIVIFLLWISSLFLFWKKILIRIFCISLLALAFCIAILPGKNIDSKMLRKEYVNMLLKYEGTIYIWGGENKFGIDCSGLVRRGLINANLKLGIIKLNPFLIKQGLFLWWNDLSAIALGKETYGVTKFILSAPDLNKLDYSKILYGDIAVTDSGAHTMAYVGNKIWIAADPLAQHVIKFKIPEHKNPYFCILHMHIA